MNSVRIIIAICLVFSLGLVRLRDDYRWVCKNLPNDRLSWAQNLAPSRWVSLPPDSINSYEDRFQAIRSQLPSRELVGYRDFSGEGVDRAVRYFLAQYAVVPTLLDPEVDRGGPLRDINLFNYAAEVKISRKPPAGSQGPALK